MNDRISPAYYLPERVSLIVQAHIGRCKNPALILGKYIEKQVIDKTEKTSDRTDEKIDWLQRFNKDYNFDAELARHAYQRWKVMMETLGATTFEAELAWRMVVGLGGESVLETNITLHHLYGIPYIPASALKGLTRAFVVGEEEAYFINGGEKHIPSPKEETDPDIVKQIFGTQESAGTVCFHDAMLINGKSAFVVDIINPHYPKYYTSLEGQSIKSPTSDQSPIPVPFLTVQDATFAFALTAREPASKDAENHLALAQKWLLKALQQYGIGGKTSAGYGYFKDNSQETGSQGKQPGSIVLMPQIVSQEENWQRPNIPHFQEGNGITKCRVIQPDEAMRHAFPQAGAFLKYLEWSSTYVYIVIEEQSDIVRAWKPNDTKNCIFLREERYGNRLVLVCKPSPPKNKKKK